MFFQLLFIALLIFSFLLSPQFIFSEDATADSIEKLNKIEMRLVDLIDKEKSLKEMVDFMGTDKDSKQSIPDQLGGDESKDLKLVQEEIVALKAQRQQLVSTIGGNVWSLQNVIVNPDNIPSTNRVDVKDEVNIFRALNRSQGEMVLKGKTLRDKKYDAAITFTFNVPAIVSGNATTIDVKVSGSMTGDLGESICIGKVTATGNTPITVKYEGQGEDKNCWVGNLRNVTKLTNAGIYKVPLSETDAGLYVHLQMAYQGSPTIATYYFQRLPPSSLLK